MHTGDASVARERLWGATLGKQGQSTGTAEVGMAVCFIACGEATLGAYNVLDDVVEPWTEASTRHHSRCDLQPQT